MGKKSKQRKSTKVSQCYHGCTKKEFNNCGEHYKVIEDWIRVVKLHEKDINDFLKKRTEFLKTNKRIMDDPKFSCYVVAHVTEDHLKGLDGAILFRRLLLLVDMRYKFIPRHEGKNVGPESEYSRNYHKYLRDIQTERGRINVIAREIPCNCMEEKRIAAQSMAKVAKCYCCEEVFLKEQMLYCKCDRAQYCSKQCYKKDWPHHKTYCKNGYVVSSATTP